eukprot:g2406.t1
MSLHLSVIKGDWKSCLTLLSDDTCDVNAKERTGGTPLMVAASMMEVDLEVVKKMLERGAKIDDVDDEGFAALHEAANAGNFRMVKLLIERGAKVSFPATSTGVTALQLAAAGGAGDPTPSFYQALGLTDRECTAKEIGKAYRKIMLELHPDRLREKADDKDIVRRRDLVQNAYRVLSDEKRREAYDTAYIRTLTCLLGKVKDEKEIERAIEIALKFRQWTLAGTLLRDDVNRKLRFGRTLLHNAVAFFDLVSAKALLKMGANPNQSDDRGETPLALAKEMSNDKMVELFESRSLD